MEPMPWSLFHLFPRYLISPFEYTPFSYKEDSKGEKTAHIPSKQ
jgi:hypothetical protein